MSTCVSTAFCPIQVCLSVRYLSSIYLSVPSGRRGSRRQAEVPATTELCVACAYVRHRCAFLERGRAGLPDGAGPISDGSSTGGKRADRLGASGPQKQLAADSNQPEMSRRYDSRTTIFSPEGRLYQVEYALEAINHAGTAIGIMAKDGIALVAERKVTSKLLEQDSSAEKMYILNESTLCGVAGMTADAGILINYVREASQEYLKVYNKEPPLEHIVKKVCNLKQGYTQYGGLRPFGVSFLFAGHDDRHGFQLYTSNPSGNYSGWKATSIGANNSSAQTILKQEYKDDLYLEDAKKLALKVLSKTTDSTKLTSDKVEFSTVSLNGNGHVELKIWKPEEIDALIQESGILHDDDNSKSDDDS